MPPSPDQSDAIKEALFAGHKISAIKLYREQKKVGLAEAKAAVEALEAQLRLASPERFTAPQSRGCFAAILVLGLLVLGLLGLAFWKAHR